MSDCSKCGGECCRGGESGIQIELNSADLLKIDYALKLLGKDYELVSAPHIIINELKPGLPPNYINSPCPFQDDSNKCILHDLVVARDSELSARLISSKISLRVKPLVCRAHPYFYELASDRVYEWNDCCNMTSAQLVSDAQWVKDEYLACMNF